MARLGSVFPGVETQPCSGATTTGNHELTNMLGETVCVGCLVSWADLDAILRSTL